MKLIKPSFKIIEQQPELEGLYKQIEMAGRTCYKSEDKITEDSAKEFVDRMIKSGHGAMLEHGTVYLALDMASREQYFKYCYNKFSVAKSIGNAEYSTWKGFVTTNLRVLVENDWMDDLQYLCEPTEYHEKRITVKFITDQGILREFTRHRTMSFAVESTRYCNYSKDKFGNEITYILPPWIGEKDIPKGFGYTSDDWGSLICEFYYDATEKGKEEGFIIEPVRNFVFALQTSEQLYFSLLKQGWKPQQARNVLPLATKCDIVMTGFVSDWKHFFELRDAGSAHPQARELAQPLHKLFIEKKWLD